MLTFTESVRQHLSPKVSRGEMREADRLLILRALIAGVARWEPFPNQRAGEFCIGGLRHCTDLGEDGAPEMTSGMRAAILARITGPQS